MTFTSTPAAPPWPSPSRPPSRASRPARAQGEGERAAAAQALFDEAMRLMKAEQTAAACPKLEESQRLDPGMGTEFRLAECYEKVGKLASAWAKFVSVADSAAVARLSERETVARQRAQALVPRLSKLVISVPREVAATPGWRCSATASRSARRSGRCRCPSIPASTW